MDYEYMRKRIKELLEEKSMTQRELADKVEVSEVAMSSYLSGRIIPKGPIIVKISQVLEVELEDLMGREKM